MAPYVDEIIRDGLRFISECLWIVCMLELEAFCGLTDNLLSCRAAESQNSSCSNNLLWLGADGLGYDFKNELWGRTTSLRLFGPV